MATKGGVSKRSPSDQLQATIFMRYINQVWQFLPLTGHGDDGECTIYLASSLDDAYTPML